MSYYDTDYTVIYGEQANSTAVSECSSSYSRQIYAATILSKGDFLKDVAQMLRACLYPSQNIGISTLGPRWTVG